MSCLSLVAWHAQLLALRIRLARAERLIHTADFVLNVVSPGAAHAAREVFNDDLRTYKTTAGIEKCDTN